MGLGSDHLYLDLHWVHVGYLHVSVVGIPVLGNRVNVLMILMILCVSSIDLGMDIAFNLMDGATVHMWNLS